MFPLLGELYIIAFGHLAASWPRMVTGCVCIRYEFILILNYFSQFLPVIKSTSARIASNINNHHETEPKKQVALAASLMSPLFALTIWLMLVFMLLQVCFCFTQ